MKPITFETHAIQSEFQAAVILDFDGTITEVDTTDEILDRFANNEWKTIERRWEEGKIGSQKCLSMQTALISATPKQIDLLLQQVPVDPGYLLFARACQDLNIPLLIVSDGYDRSINKVLRGNQLASGIFSSRLISMGSRHWRLRSPHFSFSCRSGASTCKCEIAKAAKIPIVLVGDGQSDFCIAEKADYVLAKGKLAEHCSKNKISYFPFRDLSEASGRIREIAASMIFVKQCNNRSSD